MCAVIKLMYNSYDGVDWLTDNGHYCWQPVVIINHITCHRRCQCHCDLWCSEPTQSCLYSTGAIQQRRLTSIAVAHWPCHLSVLFTLQQQGGHAVTDVCQDYTDWIEFLACIYYLTSSSLSNNCYWQWKNDWLVDYWAYRLKWPIARHERESDDASHRRIPRISPWSTPF